MIHPSMIYGIQEEKTVSRLLDWVKTRSWVPLPGGGYSLVQPAYSEDIVQAFYESIFNEKMLNQSFVVAAHQPLSYREMIIDCALLQGRKVKVVNVPGVAMLFGARLLQWTPLKNKLKPDQVKRLMENKNFDVTPIEKILGRSMHTFMEGLAKIRN